MTQTLMLSETFMWKDLMFKWRIIVFASRMLGCLLCQNYKIISLRLKGSIKLSLGSAQQQQISYLTITQVMLPQPQTTTMIQKRPIFAVQNIKNSKKQSHRQKGEVISNYSDHAGSTHHQNKKYADFHNFYERAGATFGEASPLKFLENSCMIRILVMSARSFDIQSIQRIYICVFKKFGDSFHLNSNYSLLLPHPLMTPTIAVTWMGRMMILRASTQQD